MAKRKAAKPKVKAGSLNEVKEKLIRKGIKAEHLQDLERFDRSELVNPNPDKRYYYGLARDIPLHQKQGYTVEDDPNLKTSAPGEGKVWKAEGKDTHKDGQDLVLLSMPKELYEAREEFRRAKKAERNQTKMSKLKKEALRGVDPEVASLFAPDQDLIDRMDRG